MNDTEAEARHLLAAATEDMPPGIDLLGGFAAARRRDRTRRTRTRAVASAGIAAAAASATALALAVGSATPALATVTSALSRTLGQTYHLTDQVSGSIIVDRRVASRFRDTCRSVADPVRRLEAMTCADGGVYRAVGRYGYFYQGPRGSRQWARTGAACHPPPDNGPFTTATPQQMLADIKQSTNVTVVGPASGPGWTGRKYAFSGRGSEAGHGTEVSGTVTVDQQGRARTLSVSIRPAVAGQGAVMRLVLTFSDFGVPVTVNAPPPDQTFPISCH